MFVDHVLPENETKLGEFEITPPELTGASKQRWLVSYRPRPETDETSLKTGERWKLIRVRKTGQVGGHRNKRSFWLAWNGARLAGNRDAGILAAYHPELYRDLVNLLTPEDSPF